MNQLGTNNFIGKYSVLGLPKQIIGIDPTAPSTGVILGDNNTIREYVSVHDDTRIGNGNYIMCYVVLNHDCQIGDYNIISSGVNMAGHVRVMDRVNIGANVCIHQFVTIGSYSMIGMGAVVIEDVPPFMKVVGNPARIIGYNEIGLKRNGFTDTQIKAIKNHDHPLYVEFDKIHTRKMMKWKGEPFP